MDIQEYLQDPCRMLSIPYWKAQNMTVPDHLQIVHCSDWRGQYRSYQRFFRMRHSLQGLGSADPDRMTLSIDRQAAELAGMINVSYRGEHIVVTVEDILHWKTHETFREDLWVCIHADDGTMAASGIAEYDETCREGIIEWVQVLPDLRRKGFGQRIVLELLRRLKRHGAAFATVSGNLDSPFRPQELYRKCGFTGDDIWYICRI